jgi:hypothetical protein
VGLRGGEGLVVREG